MKLLTMCLVVFLGFSTGAVAADQSDVKTVDGVIHFTEDIKKQQADFMAERIREIIGKSK